MFREFFETLIGIAVAALGILLMYYYLTSIDKGANYLYLLLSLVFLAGSVFLFVHAEKADTVILKRVRPEEGDSIAETANKSGLSDKLQKNNEMISEWGKTNEARDKMKLVELSTQTNSK